MCRPVPSATSMRPTRRRKASASIFMVGWRSTNVPMAPAKAIITPTAITMAATITERWPAMPTAVMTESSEKTTSRTAIWKSTMPKAAAPPGARRGSWRTSSLSWISKVALVMRKSPPPARIRSRPVKPWPRRRKSSRVSPMSQVTASRSRRRLPSARASPMRRAAGCRSGGSFPARTARKTTLSIPSTISMAESVARLIRVAGWLQISIMAGPFMPEGTARVEDRRAAGGRLPPADGDPPPHDFRPNPWFPAAPSRRPPVRRTTLALAVLLAAPAGAEEGMWMPMQVPALAPRLAALGFRGDPAAFADLTGDPMGAIVSLGGCSASFVSPDGLVATNHHCALFALQQNSTPARNLLRDGFLARARSEEICAGPLSRVYVTVSVKDVTDRITGHLSPRLSDLARQQAIERRQKERLAACERGGLHCRVASFFDGLLWLEIAQHEIRDVRLVYAPPSGVGNFGGETDNWMWPRHAGDFALYRAYVRPDGKSAAHAEQNVPYRPARWLRVSSEGAKPGDFVMVAGYPGKTERLYTFAEARAALEWTYPRTVRLNRERLALLAGLARSDPERAIRVNTRIRGLANSMKNREGVLEGAARLRYLERKRQEERALLDWIEADAKRRAAYRGALPGLDAIQAGVEKTRERDAVFEALHGYQSLLGAARTMLRLSAEREKPDLERDLEYQQRNWGRIREAQQRMQRSEIG